jgi:hypothetical protein
VSTLSDVKQMPVDTRSDHFEICALEAAYGPRWDANDGTAWSELFTEDGVFAVAQPDGTPEVRARGRSELKGRSDLFNAAMRGVHLLGQPELSIDGDTARATIPFSFWGSGTTVRRRYEVVGLYKVEYARTAEGWRMRYRYEVPISRTTHEMLPRDIDDIAWLSTVAP